MPVYVLFSVAMDAKKWSIIFLVLTPVFVAAWKSSREDRREIRELTDRRESRRGIHYHTKRHMLPENDSKQRRVTTQKSRDLRKKVKPSGHLTPLEEDDMDNDEVVSVAIGPPPIRPKYDKMHWKHPPAKPVNNNVTNNTAVNLIKDVLTQLGRELLSRQVSEEFVFGQYVGNSMKNLTSDLKLKMQHELLEIIVKYQRWNRGETPKAPEEKPATSNPLPVAMMPKDVKPERKFIPANETEDTWPDFSNLAKIVG